MTRMLSPISEGTDRGPLVIGLTGPIASGKSTVAAMLAEWGAEVIDGDDVYRSLLTPESELSRRIIARFGSTVADGEGHIDRAVLGALVFADHDALRDLDRLSHPAVVSEVRRMVRSSKAPVVVVEAVKLVQSGMHQDIDSLWVVSADPETRLKRLIARSALDERDARRRLDVAVDPIPPHIKPDIIIDSSGTLEATARQVGDAWKATVTSARETLGTRLAEVNH